MTRLFGHLRSLIGRRDLGLIAAGVAFYAMLSLFPGVAAVIAVWGLWADPAVVETQMAYVTEFVPDEVLAVLSAQIEALVRTGTGTLGWTTALSMLVSLWSARLGADGLIRGLNQIHGVENRHGLWQTALALALTLALVVIALITLATVVVMPLVAAFLPLGPAGAWAVTLSRWAAAPVIAVLGLGLIYRYGPNLKAGRRCAWVSPGSVLALLLWVAASVGLSVYLANFASYNEVYGSIGAAIALLIWLYIGAYAVLLGAVLNVGLAESRAAP